MIKTTLEISASAAIEADKALEPGYVVLTLAGKPVAYLLPASIYDEEDIGYMLDPEFWKMIAERRASDEFIPFDDFKSKLERREMENSTVAP